MPTALKSRIAWIDLLETIAIFLVILCHTPLYELNLISPSGYIVYLLNTIKTVGVPLFFFINGYLLFSKKFDLRRHLCKIIHLVIITIFWGALAAIVLNNFQITSISSLVAAKSHLSYLWFMGALIIIYLFFPILKVTYDHKPQYILYFIIMCAIFTFGNTLLNQLYTLYSSALLHQSAIHYDTNFFNMFNPFQGIHGYTLVYFCLGGLAYYYREKVLAISQKRRNLIASIGITIGIVGLFLTGVMYTKTAGYYWDIVFNGYDSIFALCLALSVYLLALNWSNTRHKTLNYLLSVASNNTLGIYFLHQIIIFLTISSIKEIPLFCNFFGAIVYGVIVFIFSLAISVILRKLPLVRKTVS